MSQAIVPTRGMRDFLPKEKAKRERVLQILRQVYSAYGYCEIETPVLEDLDCLRGSGGGENLNLIFEVLKRGLAPEQPITPAAAADLGLRYDLTLPLSRFYASHVGELPAECRTLQMASVWRAERPQKGRYRQFMQCDIDIIGVAEDRAEVELICVTLQALRALGLNDVVVRLNDRRILSGFLQVFAYSDSEQPRVLMAIDKLDKIGLNGVAAELNSCFPGHPGNAPMSTFLAQLTELTASTSVSPLENASSSENGSVDFTAAQSLTEKLCRLLIDKGVAPELLQPLQHILSNVATAMPAAQLRFDPTLVRGMGYYTGPIFEIVTAQAQHSIAGGGRYDGMIGRFLQRPVPACGFSIGFERIVDMIVEQTDTHRPEMVLFYDEEISSSQVFCCQHDLVRRGYTVRTHKTPKKMAKALENFAQDGVTGFARISAEQANSLNSIPDDMIRPLHPNNKA